MAVLPLAQRPLAVLGISVSAVIAAVAVYYWTRTSSNSSSKPDQEALKKPDSKMTSHETTGASEEKAPTQSLAPPASSGNAALDMKEKHRSPSETSNNSTSDSGHSWNDMVDEEEEQQCKQTSTQQKQNAAPALDGSFLSSKLEKLSLNDSSSDAIAPAAVASVAKKEGKKAHGQEKAATMAGTQQNGASSKTKSKQQPQQGSPAHDSGITSPTEAAAADGAAAPTLNGPDSGQGSESGDSTPPTAPEDKATCQYQFLISNFHAGRLIGLKGKTIQTMKNNSQCQLHVTKPVGTDIATARRSRDHRRGGHHGYNDYKGDKEYQTCTVEGSKANVFKCLKLIREFFPENAYPDLSLYQVSGSTEFGTSPAEMALNQPSPHLCFAQRHLQEVVVSSFRNAGHFFLQMPHHYTYSLLSRLQECMDHTYKNSHAPVVPRDAPVGLVCVAPYEDGYHRVQVTALGADDTLEVKYLDYGDLATTPRTSLRQIRTDFFELPWQAVEVRLANVVPVNARTHGYEFASETAEEMYKLLKDKCVTSHLVGYSLDGLPLVNLYSQDYPEEGKEEDAAVPEPVLVNRQLVDVGLAQWVEQQVMAPEVPVVVAAAAAAQQSS